MANRDPLLFMGGIIIGAFTFEIFIVERVSASAGAGIEGTPDIFIFGACIPGNAEVAMGGTTTDDFTFEAFIPG